MSTPRPAPGSDEARVWARHVRSARDELEPTMAAALRLVYEQAATPAEAAARLGLDVRQIHVTLAAGLRELVSTVGTSGPGDPGATG